MSEASNPPLFAVFIFLLYFLYIEWAAIQSLLSGGSLMNTVGSLVAALALLFLIYITVKYIKKEIEESESYFDTFLRSG